MTDKPEQLVFDLPHRAATTAEDFLVSASNEVAVTAIDAWPGWTSKTLAIVGPAGAGKTHLVSVWHARTGGVSVPAAELSEGTVQLAQRLGVLAVEDIDRGIADQRVLFHLLNLARETGVYVLMTSRSAPGELEIALPDLRSRLRATAVVEIGPPDESLLKALLVKLFSDRQLHVEPHIIAHLALHMERSAAAARALVAEIDRLALTAQRRVTRVLAAEALQRLRQMSPEL